MEFYFFIDWEVKLKLFKWGFFFENLKFIYVFYFYWYLMIIIVWYGVVDCGCIMLLNVFIFGINYIGSFCECFDFFFYEGLWKYFFLCVYICLNLD